MNLSLALDRSATASSPRRSASRYPADRAGRQRTPGRIVVFRDDFGACVRRAELRLVRQLLQGVVVPELHFDATVQRPAPGRCIAGCQAARPMPAAGDSVRRQTELILNGQRHPMRARPGQAELVAVDAGIPLG